MRYCMRFYLNWHRNYAWSKLELQYLLNKNQTYKFDLALLSIVKLGCLVHKTGFGKTAILCTVVRRAMDVIVGDAAEHIQMSR